MLEQYIKKDLILLNWTVADRHELFRRLAQVLKDKGYVNDGFEDFLNHRENNYPTGLQLDQYAVAIPHGDPKYIHKPFVAVVTLAKPITMHRMDDAGQTVAVDTFFILGLNSGADHIKLLQNIIQMIQKESFVQQIEVAATPQNVLTAIENVSVDA